MRRSEIDRRAKKTVPRQCVADYGMHKDAPAPPTGRVIHSEVPLCEMLRRRAQEG